MASNRTHVCGESTDGRCRETPMEQSNYNREVNGSDAVEPSRPLYQGLQGRSVRTDAEVFRDWCIGMIQMQEYHPSGYVTDRLEEGMEGAGAAKKSRYSSEDVAVSVEYRNPALTLQRYQDQTRPQMQQRSSATRMEQLGTHAVQPQSQMMERRQMDNVTAHQNEMGRRVLEAEMRQRQMWETFQEQSEELNSRVQNLETFQEQLEREELERMRKQKVVMTQWNKFCNVFETLQSTFKRCEDKAFLTREAMSIVPSAELTKRQIEREIQTADDNTNLDALLDYICRQTIPLQRSTELLSQHIEEAAKRARVAREAGSGRPMSPPADEGSWRMSESSAQASCVPNTFYLSGSCVLSIDCTCSEGPSSDAASSMPKRAAPATPHGTEEAAKRARVAKEAGSGRQVPSMSSVYYQSDSGWASTDCECSEGPSSDAASSKPRRAAPATAHSTEETAKRARVAREAGSGRPMSPPADEGSWRMSESSAQVPSMSSVYQSDSGWASTDCECSEGPSSDAASSKPRRAAPATAHSTAEDAWMKQTWTSTMLRMEKEERSLLYHMATIRDKEHKTDLELAVGMLINGVTDEDASFFNKQVELLGALLKGHVLRVGDNKTVSIQGCPGAALHCRHLIAQTIVGRGDEVAANPMLAYPLAALARKISCQQAEVGRLLQCYFYRDCPYLIPYCPQRQRHQTSKNFFRQLGYKVLGSEVECQVNFEQRMVGLMRLYAAMMESPLPGDESRFFNLGRAWRWLTRILKQQPVPGITAIFILELLKMTGNALREAYQREFLELVSVLYHTYVPQIELLDDPYSSVSRLKSFLDTMLQNQCRLPEPKGMLEWRSRQLESSA